MTAKIDKESIYYFIFMEGIIQKLFSQQQDLLLILHNTIKLYNITNQIFNKFD